jgi:hypothetical protein
MKFIRAEDGCYYNHDKIVLLRRIVEEENKPREVLSARFVGGVSVNLFTSTDIPGGIDAYLMEHELEMWE